MENPKSKYFMTLALMQANKVLGKTRTNPAVGCVIVKNNSLISAASTSFNGRPHAESNALKKIKKKIKKYHFILLWNHALIMEKPVLVLIKL